jgi:sec-independent protein translocase protein TatC
MSAPQKDIPRFITEHLRELRAGLIRAILAITAGSVAAFALSGWIFRTLLNPFQSVLAHFPQIAGRVQSLQTLSPVEVFMVNMKLAFIAGLVLASPFVLREIWVFSVPALKPRERSAILMVFSLGLFFFLAGLAFGYFVIIPLALRYLMWYNLIYHFMPQWTLEAYFGFVVNFLLIFGFVFELPLVLAALVKIGVATPAFLCQKRRHAIFLVFVLAFFIAPSADPITMTLVAVPLALLYEVGIWLSRLAFRKNAINRLR